MNPVRGLQSEWVELMLFGTKSHLIVLHDAEEVQVALQVAMIAAPQDQVPGLKRALEILAEVSGDSPALLEQRWAQRVLAKRGFDPARQEAESIRALRQEVPGLALGKATELVRRVRSTTAHFSHRSG